MQFKPSVVNSAALIIGFAHSYFFILCWGYIAAYTPILRWLLDLGLRDGSLRAVLYPLDFTTSVALSVPAALLLVKLGASHVVPLVFAVLPPLIWHQHHLIGDPILMEILPGLLFDCFQQLFALPAAVLLMVWATGPRSPNNVLQDDALNARA